MVRHKESKNYTRNEHTMAQQMGVKTFLTFDKADGFGTRAQVTVNTGTLPVKAVKAKNGILEVEFDHTAANLNFPVKAHTIEGSPLADYLAAIAGTDQLVTFRTETHRKAGIDRRLPFPPIDERDRQADVTYLVKDKGVEVVKKLVMADDVVSDELGTDPREDSKWESIPRPQIPAYLEASTDTNTPASFGDPITALGTLAHAGGYDPLMVNVLAAFAVAAGEDADKVKTLVDRATAVVAPRTGRASGAMQEAAPWSAMNFDGRVNLGSYEVRAAADALAFAESHLTAAYTAGDADPAIAASITPERILKQAEALAAVLLAVADAVQTGAYGVTNPMRAANSHSIARKVVYRVVDMASETFVAAHTAGRSQEWVNNITLAASARFTAAEHVNATGDRMVTAMQLTIPQVGKNTAPAETPKPAPAEEPAPAPAEAPQAAPAPAPAAAAVVADTQLSVEQAADMLDATTLPYLNGDGPMLAETRETAADDEQVASFTRLTEKSGLSHAATVQWLQATYGTDNARKLTVERMGALLDYYRSFGSQALSRFVADVNAVVGEQQAAA